MVEVMKRAGTTVRLLASSVLLGNLVRDAVPFSEQLLSVKATLMTTILRRCSMGHPTGSYVLLQAYVGRSAKSVYIEFCYH